MSIGRRGFLGGIISAVAGGEALVKLASPLDASLLKPGHEARMFYPGAQVTPSWASGRVYVAFMQDNVYPDGSTVRAEFVGWLKNVTLSRTRESVDATEWGAVSRHLIPGRVERQLSLEMSPDPGSRFIIDNVETIIA